MSNVQAMQDQLCDAVHQNKVLSKIGLQERLFTRLFEGLVYAQIWEDPVSDMVALDIQPSDNIVCIASGGCNLMSYLTLNPASITAVDLSPAHVALNRLKLSAAQHLDSYEDFYSLLARADRPENTKLITEQLNQHLDQSSKEFWAAKVGIKGRRYDLFEKGLYRFGVLGRFIGAAHLVAKVARVDFKPYLQCTTLGQRQAYFDSTIAPLFEKRLFKFLARQPLALFGLGIPPAQYDKLAFDGGGDIIPVLKERVRKLMCDFPVSENYFAWQAFNRAYDSSSTASLPPYLEEKNFETVKKNAVRAKILNRSVTEMLAMAPNNSKQCYILLDAQDWMTDEQLNALWREITRTASEGARVIFRTGGSEDILPGRVAGELLERWDYDKEASEQGFCNDRSAIYGGFHLYRLTSGQSHD